MSVRLSDRRIRLLVVLFGVLFALTLARSAWLQAVRAPSLSKLAQTQQRQTVALPAHRGSILDRMGVELAIGEEATTVYADPTKIVNPRRVAGVVAGDLGLDEQEVLAKISDRSRGFVYLARKADPDQAKVLEARDIQGLGFYPEERRTYPQGRVGASAIGYAGLDNHGLAGVELRYEDALAGTDGEETIVRDPLGRLLDVSDTKPVQEGKDITLTLDARLQAQVERILRKARVNWGAKSATALVLDPRTGGILAMAVDPGFDANSYGDVPADVVRNRAVTDTYEPGSTFKVITVAGALEDGVVHPSSVFTVPPSIEVSDRVIHEAEERDTEIMTVSQILSRSSNVGAVMLAQELTAKRLAAWIDRFGFGHPTGVDFPGESGGIVLPLKKWTGSTIGNVPIGQGIAVTPLQMAAVYAAIANRGVWLQPHLVERVGGADVDLPAGREIVSRGTAKALTRMMMSVVEEGTGTEAAVSGYTVAGKTGTSAKAEAGGYSDSRYVASFVGFAPARAPRVVILVAVDEPKGEIFGGQVAAPAFSQIAEFALHYLDVPPDAPETEATS